MEVQAHCPFEAEGVAMTLFPLIREWLAGIKGESRQMDASNSEWTRPEDWTDAGGDIDGGGDSDGGDGGDPHLGSRDSE